MHGDIDDGLPMRGPLGSAVTRHTLSERPVNPAKFAAITVQLALLLVALRLFGIETGSGLSDLCPLLFAGFVVNAWLPVRARLPFFLALSFGAFWLLFGFRNTVLIVALGLALLGIAHAPVALGWRVVLLLLAGLGLAAVRIAWNRPAPPPDAAELKRLSFRVSQVLPVLGALFMFRLAMYLYDVRNERTRSTIWERLSYFFMLPAVCFPLFPTIDYATFRRTYYRGDPFAAYLKGTQWICRGLIHLLLYRVVYHYLTPAAQDVADLGDVVLFVTSSYLLYLRISGTFHIIIGILCLFGFNLPESHHLYFLAGSVNDFWRRINIYWKEFMMKMVYYPIFMRIRRKGMYRAMVIGTIGTLILSWFLHSYQWFWLRRPGFPVHVQDAVFWTTLGILVAANSVWEAARPVKRSLAPGAWSLPVAVQRAVKTVAMFCFMSLLWSYWTAPSVSEWADALAVTASCGPGQLAWLGAGVLGVIAAGVAGQWVFASRPMVTARTREPFWAGSLRTAVTAAVLVVAGLPAVHEAFGLDGSDLIYDLTDDHLSKADENRSARGYYEEMLNREVMSNGIWGSGREKPDDWIPLRNAEGGRLVNDMRVWELVPSRESVFHRTRLETNRWGMRDSECDKKKPDRTYRIALLGGSNVMGSGVEFEETFHEIVERRLNRERPSAAHDRYEILSFGVDGYSAAINAYQLEHGVLEFEPDAVLLVGTSNLHGFCVSRFRDAIEVGIDFSYPELRRLKEESGVSADLATVEWYQKFRPCRDRIVPWALEKIAALCRDAGVPYAFVLMPRFLKRDPNAAKLPSILRLAEQNGFVMMSLTHAVEGISIHHLQVAPWDTHPNAEGHRRLAKELYSELMEKGPLLGLPVSRD